MTRAAAIAAVLVLAGCGGGTTTPPVAKPPHIPRALAQAWVVQANEVAQALADHDGCTAVAHANELRDAVASGEAQVPRRLRATLVAAVNGLPGRITCNPAPPPKTHPPHPHPPHPHPEPPKHDGHGHGPGQGDQG
ncbi:MAG: hypothetical protein ACRDNM_01775 [Gaiellaceae bacterium]